MSEELCKNCSENNDCPECRIHEKAHHEPCECCKTIVSCTSNG